jgi:hypothetical protein
VRRKGKGSEQARRKGKGREEGVRRKGGKGRERAEEGGKARDLIGHSEQGGSGVGTRETIGWTRGRTIPVSTNCEELSFPAQGRIRRSEEEERRKRRRRKGRKEREEGDG